MDFYPEFKVIEEQSKEYPVVPMMCEIMADMLTPVNLYLALRGEEDCFLLESAEEGEGIGRYSFIGVHPEMTIRVASGEVEINKEGDIKWQTTSDPLDIIKKIVEDNRSPILPNFPKFTGGLVGYFGYDTVRYIEKKVNKEPEDDLEMADIYLVSAKEIIVFDHLKHKLLLIGNVRREGNLLENYEGVKKDLEALADKINHLSFNYQSQGTGDAEGVVTSLLSEEEFIKSVKKAQEYIVDGDIFQVVLSQRFEVLNPPDPFKVYRMLRTINPSPYMYHFQFKEGTIVGASPETLVSVENREVTTYPIAGTIRRGKDEKEDNALENQLFSDEKEQAEHVMLVDLARNDLGKISQFGTVEVGKFMEVEKYARLMHLVSRVTGTLREGLDAIDALKAVIPAGTLSGAPKVRAMEIIDELETRKRNLYGGTIGYLGYNGVMDTCIAIRTALFKGNKGYVQAGAGIVADSIPEKEYRECCTKASAMLSAIEKAGELR